MCYVIFKTTECYSMQLTEGYNMLRIIIFANNNHRFIGFKVTHMCYALFIKTKGSDGRIFN